MQSFKKPLTLRLAFLALIVTLTLPLTSFAQGRGRERNRDFDRSSKKCGKFVNCHDARDGRWDGRGPRRSRFSNSQDWWRDHNNRFNRRERRYSRNDRYRYQRNEQYRYQRNRYARRY
jgi:hypothetical protein